MNCHWIYSLVVLLSFSAFAASPVRPECAAWEESLETVVTDTTDSPWKIRSDKKIEDLLSIIKNYPAGLQVDASRQPKESLLELVKRLEETPQCAALSYYGALETLINYPGADLKIKKKLLKTLFERTNRGNFDKVTFLYTMFTQHEIQKLIEAKVMGVNDIQYFELGRIGDEIQKTKQLLEEKSLRAPEDQKCVSKLSACSEEQLGRLSDLYWTESREASRLYLQLAYWVNRVKPTL